MTYQFYKYQGTGNDFVMIDNRTSLFPKENKALIAEMCHRRFGIGADGLILLENAAGYDFRMTYFNADGGEGSMCGNGGRCTVAFAKFLKIFEQRTRFTAIDGAHEASLEEDWIHLKMIPVKGIETQPEYYFLNTGSPHTVTFVDNLTSFPVVSAGREIRYSSRFAEAGTNVNFAEIINENDLFVRTYERGVEDETYSCGTGVTACALAAADYFKLISPIKIKTLGGSLQVSFNAEGAQSFQEIYLAGPAVQVFEGVYQQ
jgi:diaminopimelate epimerase